MADSHCRARGTISRAIERALADLKDGRPMPPDDAVDFTAYEEIVDLKGWSELETRFENGLGRPAST